MNQRKTTFPTVPIHTVPVDVESTKPEPHRPVVLVVDDEYVIADSLAEILKRSGYAAMSVYDGEAALETALVMPPEVLISDVVLPGMNGIELGITIRRIFPECKVILSSGQASTARLLAAADGAGHQFVLLNKPVHPKVLLERVSECLPGRKPVAGVQSPAMSVAASQAD
jgi:DNA-binding response OmpR family regulator